MSYIAIAGVVVAAGGAAYSAYSQNQAIDAANSAHPAPFVPVDIPKTAQAMFALDKANYAYSQQDWEKRFPLLQKGKTYNENDMAGNLAGVTSPVVSQSMNTAGLSSDLGNDSFKQSRNLGKPILGMEQRGRNYFQTTLAENPQKAAGLTSGQYGQLLAQNTGAQNAYNTTLFGNELNKYNSQVAQNIQNTNAVVGGLGSFAGLLTQNNKNNAGNNVNYLDTSGYNYLTTGTNMRGG